MASPGIAETSQTRSRFWGEPSTLAAFAFASLIVLILASALVVAIFLPYGEWDAMSFGTWSRLIADHWPHLRFAGINDADYHRPLFYALQGTVWSIFGFHQALGRVLSLLFSVTLLAAVAFIAAQTVRADRRLAAWLAPVAVLLITPFTRYIAGGMSDIPAAAMVAVTAAVLLAPRLGRAQWPLVAVSAALATLAKPSALPALAGLVLAVLIGPRAALGRRAAAAGAIGGGMALGVVYDVVQAEYVHVGLRDFLTSGTGGFYTQLAKADRRRVLLDGGWLSAELRVVLVFALVYALARVFLRHRPAVGVAFPAAVLWSWLGPHLAGAHGVRVGILGTGDWLVQLAVLALAASLLFSLSAPAEAIPERLLLIRGLVWMLPTFVVWALRAVYDNRLLAPAWPPLVLLIVWAFLPAFAGARLRREWLLAVPAAAIIVLGAYTVENINGLGSSGWRQLQAGGLSGLENPARMRDIALGGDFAAELNALAPQVRSDDRILTFDARLRFFYLNQIDYAPPQSCDQLAGHRIFVLLESDELRTIYGQKAGSGFWQECRSAHLTKVDERPGAYAIFVKAH